MKTRVLPLLGIMLFFAACEVTVTDTESTSGNGGRIGEKEESTYRIGDVQATRHLPTDYYIKDLYAFSYDDRRNSATTYTSSCKEVNNELEWKPDNAYDEQLTFDYYPERDSIHVVVNGSIRVGLFYDADLAQPFPAGLLYQADQVNEYSINGFVIGADTYAHVGFINTSCPVEDLDFADEILDFLKINENDRVTYDCNSVDAAGVKIQLVSNRPTEVSYAVSYNGYRCDVTETLRFAYYREDCEAAYADFLIDVEADPQLKFNMTDYSYGLSTESISCLDDLLDEFFMDAPLYKTQKQKPTGRDFAKALAKMSQKIRK